METTKSETNGNPSRIRKTGKKFEKTDNGLKAAFSFATTMHFFFALMQHRCSKQFQSRPCLYASQSFKPLFSNFRMIWHFVFIEIFQLAHSKLHLPYTSLYNTQKKLRQRKRNIDMGQKILFQIHKIVPNVKIRDGNGTKRILLLGS